MTRRGASLAAPSRGQMAMHRRLILAVLLGLLLVIILLKIGEDANYEFIYFQF